MSNDSLLDSPDKIAEAGEAIYSDRHKTELEAKHHDRFVAIDVLTGEAYIGEFPEEALQLAREKAPNGIFHLIRIGAPGTFKISFGPDRHGVVWNWALRHQANGLRRH